MATNSAQLAKYAVTYAPSHKKSAKTAVPEMDFWEGLNGDCLYYLKKKHSMC